MVVLVKSVAIFYAKLVAILVNLVAMCNIVCKFGCKLAIIGSRVYGENIPLKQVFAGLS